MSDPIDRLRDYGEDLARSVQPARSRVAALRAIGSAGSTPPKRVPRLALATVSALVVVNVGTVALADSSVPGDLLYPIDRAYERVVDLVGLGGDRTPERLTEVQILVDRGQVEVALDHLADSVVDETVRETATQLIAAGPNDPELNNHVTALVEAAWQVSTAAHDGNERALEEARAAIRFLATQVAATIPGKGTPPEHSNTTGPPPQSDGQGPPDQVSPNVPSTTPGADNNGPPSHSNEQGKPDHADREGPPEHSNSDGPASQSNDQAPDPAGEQGPPAHSDKGPPDHAKNTGSPDRSGKKGPPEHSENTGVPEHSNSAGSSKGKG